MQLKFQVAAELVKLAAVSQHVLFKNKIRKKGGGGKSSQVQVFTCASCRACGVRQSPQGSSRVLWGAESFQQSVGGSSWAFAVPLGSGVAPASPSLAAAMPNPSFGSNQGPIQHLPAGAGGCGQLLWVGLALLSVMGTRPWGDAGTQPGIHLQNQWCWAGSRMCQPGQTLFSQRLMCV